MPPRLLAEQAADLTDLLPRLMRAMFTLDDSDPTMELPVAQLRVCTLLDPGPRTISDLAKELGITVSAVTQLADRSKAPKPSAPVANAASPAPPKSSAASPPPTARKCCGRSRRSSPPRGPARRGALRAPNQLLPI